MDFAVRVSGGRALAVRDAGDPAGTAVLVQSGTPGSRYLYGPNMGEGKADDIRLLMADKEAARARRDKEREEILAASVAEAAQAMTSLLQPAGAAVLTADLARHLALTHREGVSPGSQGWWG